MSWFLDFYFICACSPRNFFCVLVSEVIKKQRNSIYNAALYNKKNYKDISRIYIWTHSNLIFKGYFDMFCLWTGYTYNTWKNIPIEI